MLPLAAQIISRQRVTARIEEALTAHCLVVLTAPMGYGKTTAAEALVQHSEKRCLYLSIKPEWYTADHVWGNISLQLKKQGVPYPETLQSSFPTEEACLFHMLGFCREFLEKTPTLLIFDDYHHVSIPALDRFVSSLVREEVPGLNILLLSRTKPDLPLEYLQLKNYATVLGHDQLAFSQEEVRRLFLAAGEPEQRIADIACEFCGGWAAALRICLQSHLTDGVIKPIQNVERLLDEAFFSSQPEEYQRFLLQLSVLETFIPEQAALLCGKQSVSHFLRAVYEQNAFFSYCQESDTYTIHNLFRTYLLGILEENRHPGCAKIELKELYRRAGECSCLSGNHIQAMRFFMKAGSGEDLLRILRMFDSPDEGIFLLFDPDDVASIMKDIPWEIKALCPIGYLGFIHRYMVRIDREEAELLLEEAKRRFSEEKSFSPETKEKIQGEIELIHAVLRFNDIRAMCRCYENASRLLRGNSSLVNEDMFWTFNCPHTAFLYLRDAGDYVSLCEVVSRKLPHFQAVSSHSNAGAVDLLEAEYLLETGAIEKVAHPLRKAEYKAEEKKQLPAMLAAKFTRARLHLAEGQMQQALETIKSIQPQVMESSNPLLAYSLDTCRGYIAAVCNRVEAIPAWFFHESSPQLCISQMADFTAVVRGKALMALENWSRLEAFAENAEATSAAQNCLFARVHMLLFKTIAAMHTNVRNTARAEQYLSQVLALVTPDGIITTVAEYGEHLYPLLQRLLNFAPHKKEFVILSRLTKKYAKLSSGATIKLTLHEMDIMRIVAAGASNRDIGLELGIASGSVANSLSRIYAKMGVGSRVEAVRKWDAKQKAIGMQNG